MQRCEACRHWQEYEDQAYGRCKRIPTYSGWDDDELAPEDSAYIPVDLDAPWLRTAPDFGCVLHEPVSTTPEDDDA